jgi:hypothetical protein
MCVNIISSLFVETKWRNFLPKIGNCINIPYFHTCRLPEPLRYASMYSLQPTGETQSVPAGYQTGTRHNRAGLWDTGWPTGCRGVGFYLRGYVPANANTTERLHTSPSGDKTVWSCQTIIQLKLMLLFPMRRMGKFLQNVNLFRYMDKLEYVMNLPLCGVFLILLTLLCFIAFSAITVM